MIESPSANEPRLKILCVPKITQVGRVGAGGIKFCRAGSAVRLAIKYRRTPLPSKSLRIKLSASLVPSESDEAGKSSEGIVKRQAGGHRVHSRRGADGIHPRHVIAEDIIGSGPAEDEHTFKTFPSRNGIRASCGNHSRNPVPLAAPLDAKILVDEKDDPAELEMRVLDTVVVVRDREMDAILVVPEDTEATED